jgi:hypothetical protein
MAQLTKLENDIKSLKIQSLKIHNEELEETIDLMKKSQEKEMSRTLKKIEDRLMAIEKIIEEWKEDFEENAHCPRTIGSRLAHIEGILDSN